MKLDKYENPLTGKTDSIFDLGSLFSKVLGVVVMFFIIATGQNVASKISSKVPVDTTIEPLTRQPVVNTGNTKRIY